jgi:hypothetical protein
MVVVEYIVTSLIVIGSLVLFFRKYFSLSWAAFAVLLWLPFFQISEPSSQKLALALSCAAFVIRDSKVSRFRLSVSYALLACAYMLRTTYMIFIIIFGVWDSLKILKEKRLKGFLLAIRPRKSDWPILAVLILLIWISVMQSPHPWNNGWFCSTRWFPSKGETLADASFIQHYNWQYIYHRYGTFANKDFYFTNQEAFNGADDMIGAIRANPRFVAVQMLRNTKIFFCTAARLTMLPSFFYEKVPQMKYIYYPILLLFTIPFILAIFYGAGRSCKSKDMVLFLTANTFLIVTTIVSLPKTRNMHPLILIFILSAVWYGKAAAVIFKRTRFSSFIGQRLSKVFAVSAIPVFIVFFSNGLVAWAGITRDFARDIKNKEIKIMERRPRSFKASLKEIKPLIADCKGVLSGEHEFFGAFTDMPLNKIYDIWEIPPFGKFGDGGSLYNGLRPERVDCVLLSHSLTTSIGYGTNSGIRYQNYIKPYAQYLRKQGAVLYDIKNYGQAVILPPAPQKNKALK